MTIATIFCLASFAWVLARIWRHNAALALTALFLWPVVLLALVRNWGDEERDIRVPITAFGIALTLSVWIADAQRYAS